MRSSLLPLGLALFSWSTRIHAQEEPAESDAPTEPSPTVTPVSGAGSGGVGTGYGTNKCSQAFAWECHNGINMGCWWTNDENGLHVLDMITLPGTCTGGAGAGQTQATPGPGAGSESGDDDGSNSGNGDDSGAGNGYTYSGTQSRYGKYTGDGGLDDNSPSSPDESSPSSPDESSPSNPDESMTPQQTGIGSGDEDSETSDYPRISDNFNINQFESPQRQPSKPAANGPVATPATPGTNGGGNGGGGNSGSYNQPKMPKFATKADINCKKGKNLILYWSAYAYPGEEIAKLAGAALPCITHVILFAWDIAPYDPATPGGDGVAPVPMEKLMKPFVSAMPRTTLWNSSEEFKRYNPGLAEDVKIIPCFGGWGYDSAFREMVDNNQTDFIEALKPIAAAFDGVDIDWEYPGGDGVAYKSKTMNGANDTTGEYMGKFLNLLKTVHDEVTKPNNQLLMIAVGAREVDIGWTFPDQSAASDVLKYVDYINVMSYDYVNRRDQNIGGQKHLYSTGKATIERSIEGKYGAKTSYAKQLGIPKDKINFGWVAYSKAYPINTAECTNQAMKQGGCKLLEMEEPESGTDTSTSATITFSTRWNGDGQDLKEDFIAAMGRINGMPEGSLFLTGMDPSLASDFDKAAGADWYIDEIGKLMISWTSPKKVEKSCKELIDDYAGTFMWSLGQDFDDQPRTIEALGACVST